MLPNDEQRQLHQSAQEFLARRAPVASQRALRDRDDVLGFEPAVWGEVAGLGWTAAVFPEAYGGFDFGWGGLGGVFECIGRNLSPLPLLSSVVLGGGVLLAAGDAEQHRRWLPAVIDGSRRFALAVDEAGRHVPAWIATTAARDGDGWVLEGDKWFVIDGVGADVFIVAARTRGEPGDAQGLGLFVVEARQAGVTVERLRMVDARNAARVRLHGVRVGHDAVLGSPEGGFEPLDGVLDKARVCLAAEALGLLREVFERTLGYLKERVQFGVPIGSFQALQHRAARAHCELELLESCVAGALEAIDAGSAASRELASIAKARASDLCETLANEALQLHGGIGVTDEFDLGLFVKRARVLQQTFGDGAFHRDRYARLEEF